MPQYLLNQFAEGIARGEMRAALLCGGDIELAAGELGGAAFCVVLPLARREEAKEPEAEPTWAHRES